jgi:hypothetical protein
MAARRPKAKPYREGELETILSVAPTANNIRWLSSALQRSEKAIHVVYRFAYGHGKFGADAEAMDGKVLAAKQRVGIAIGRKTLRKQNLATARHKR